MKTRLLVGAGFLLLGLGGIGIFLPVWPTTPFVLAAAGCFSSHPALRARLEQNRFFGAYLENYRSGCGISPAIRSRSLLFLWGMLLLSMVLVRRLPITLLLAVVGALVTWHILAISKPRA